MKAPLVPCTHRHSDTFVDKASNLQPAKQIVVQSLLRRVAQTVSSFETLQTVSLRGSVA